MGLTRGLGDGIQDATQLVSKSARLMSLTIDPCCFCGLCTMRCGDHERGARKFGLAHTDRPAVRRVKSCLPLLQRQIGAEKRERAVESTENTIARNHVTRFAHDLEGQLRNAFAAIWKSGRMANGEWRDKRVPFNGDASLDVAALQSLC